MPINLRNRVVGYASTKIRMFVFGHLDDEFCTSMDQVYHYLEEVVNEVIEEDGVNGEFSEFDVAIVRKHLFLVKTFIDKYTFLFYKDPVDFAKLFNTLLQGFDSKVFSFDYNRVYIDAPGLPKEIDAYLPLEYEKRGYENRILTFEMQFTLP